MSKDRWRREARVNAAPTQDSPPAPTPTLPMPAPVPGVIQPRTPPPDKPSREQWAASGNDPGGYDAAMAEIDRRYSEIAAWEQKWYEPGPLAEKWAFAPGTERQDIDAAEAEIRRDIGTCRPPGSASPIHLVVGRKRDERLRNQ